MTYIRKYCYLGDRVIIDEHAAPAWGKGGRRSAARAATSEDQQKLNDRHAAERLRLKILANFDMGSDSFVTLTMPRGMDEEAAKKARGKFLRTMREMFAAGKFKYIAVTEKQGQWHHHLIMTYADAGVIRGTWEEAGGGRVTFSALDDSADCWDIAEYLITGDKGDGDSAKRARRKGARRWTCSKNLVQPVEPEPEVFERRPRSGPKLPKGYAETAFEEFNDKFGFRRRKWEYRWLDSRKKPPVYRENDRRRKRDGDNK